MRWVILALAAFLSVSPAAQAKPLRDARVGDGWPTLLHGLRMAADGTAMCGDTEVAFVMYVAEGREVKESNASFISVSVNGVIALVAAYDEDDLATPVVVYGDRDRKGRITDIWAVADAPNPCRFIVGTAS